MVTIRIQSKEDIIAAYLKSFGFKGDKLASVVAAVVQNLDKSGCENGEVLLGLVDNFLLKTAKKIFPQSRLDDEQLLAEFKLCFLLCGGSDKCSTEELKNFKLPLALIRQMQQNYVINAPQYKYAEMKPQVIEPFHRKKTKK